MIAKNKDFHYVDNGNAQKFEQKYFIAIRSSYISLRQGGRFVIEPYSPHRFNRQFGFHQMVPGVLKDDVRGASLEEGVYHWRVCTSSKTFSKAWLPCMPPSAKTFSSEEYKQWWARVHGNYFEENIENLINSKPKKVLPKDKRPKRGPLGEKFIRNHQQEYLQKLWGDLREKISNIPIDSLSSIQDEVMIMLKSMKIEDRLHDAKTKEAKESARISSTKEELESINRELDNLRKRKKNLTASLKRQKELLHIAHTVQQLKTRLPPFGLLCLRMIKSWKSWSFQWCVSEAAKEELKSLRPFH
ncbi:hypothetical protein DH2020_039307 [Rehmannia glutinosa]|uniref:Uncharacterized protein n=1 Tax=Rehmannia glutinosa TaxID=99300 RepID=A0ABR0UW60_REHGL